MGARELDAPVLPRDELIPWPGLNPRKLFPDTELQELQDSLAVDGMIEPLGVKLNDEPPHWIWAGERRWRAAEGVLEEVPVHIRQINEATARRLALSENIQRSALTAIEEAWGLDAYINASGVTQKNAGRELGKTQAWVSNRLRLLRLPDELQAMVQIGRINASQARDLILPFSSLTDEQWDVLSRAVAKRLRRLPKDNLLTDQMIEETVADVAIAMSGWLDQPIYGKEDTSVYPRPLRLEPKHWKTAPRGQIVTYNYDRGWRRKSSRCFDEAWWLEAMAAEEARVQERQRKAEELFADDDEEADLEWDPEQGPIPADVHVEYSQRHTVYEPENPRSAHHHGPLQPVAPIDTEGNEAEGDEYSIDFSLYVDPRAIPKEYLVLKLEEEDHWTQPAVLCTKELTYEAARVKLEESIDRTIRRRQKKQLKADLEQAQHVAWAMVPHAVAALLVSIDLRILLEWADLLGLELESQPGTLDHGFRVPHVIRKGAHAEHLLHRLESLSRSEITRLLQLGLYRFQQGRLGTDENIAREVHLELRKKLQRELAKKVDFELPTYQSEKRS